MTNIKTYSLIKKTIGIKKAKITFSITLVIFGFLLAFVPMSELGIDAKSNWWEILIKIFSSTVISILLNMLLFGPDTLAKGDSKYSKFFRKYYPSRLIKEKYKTLPGEANALWFSFLNSWSNEDNKHHTVWCHIFDSSYACRFTFYFGKILLYASIFSGLLFLFYFAYNTFYSNYFVLGLSKFGYWGTKC